MKTFKEFLLSEAPLPPDWDKSKFKNTADFSDRLVYAQQRAQELGSGSSRVVFLIQYEGRKTALKIARSPFGIQQTEKEIRWFSDPRVRAIHNIVIPMIDYDRLNKHPAWIHVEYAPRPHEVDFVAKFGAPLKDLHEYCKSKSHPEGRDTFDFKKYERIYPNLKHNKNTKNLIKFYKIIDYGVLWDFNDRGNWGLYKDGPVIIDSGLSNSIFQEEL